jgi:uncharacterized protein (TIGR01777 family)
MKLHHVLITGGNGLIGKHVTQALLKQGHKVSHLSRNKAEINGVKTYLWNVPERQIDKHCLDGVDTIIHLAGASMDDKRWTTERKQEIISSRTESIQLIYKLLKESSMGVTTIISASGVAYYGSQGNEVIPENSKAAQDFLGTCCMEWEAAVDEGKTLGLRIVKYRTGVVLTIEGGALPALAKPVKSGIGAVIGSGNQWIPWIHLQDVVDLYLLAVNDQTIAGVFNQTAPEPVTNRQMTEALASQFKKSLWMPAIPAFVLRMIMGEMSAFVLNSTKAVPQALSHENYTFKYATLTKALGELYG